MSRATIDGVTYEVVPHVCNHGAGLIEWCVCEIDTDHTSDDDTTAAFAPAIRI